MRASRRSRKNDPGGGDRAITLLEHATQSGGLQQEIGEVPANEIPIIWPTKKERWSDLGATSCLRLGTIAVYSEVDFDLLADALAAAGGRDYPALLLDRMIGRSLGGYRRCTT